MPRLDHTVPVGKRLSANERALLLLLRDLINAVRGEVGMPPLTAQALMQQMRQLLTQEDAAARALTHSGGGN